MSKQCDFCSKRLGFFSRKSLEAAKDGLCLCRSCYISLWDKNANPDYQTKQLASLALSGTLKPEIKKKIVDHLRDIVASESKESTQKHETETDHSNGKNQESKDDIVPAEKERLCKCDTNNASLTDDLPLVSSSLNESCTDSISRIAIDSLKTNDSGHFTSNYVCVIRIDDGRIFIDYHYSDDPIKYGVGRLFSHSNIKGVNYENGKYLPEGKDRLSLIALYDCQSREEALKVFEMVLNAYKTKFGSLVISNKKLIMPLEKTTPKEKPHLLHYELSGSDNKTNLTMFPMHDSCTSVVVEAQENDEKTVSDDNNDVSFLSKCTFPVEIVYGDECYYGIPTRDLFIKATENLGFRRLRIKIDKPDGYKPRYRKEFGTQFLVDSYFETYGLASLVISVTARTPLEANPIDADSFSICSGTLCSKNSVNHYHKKEDLTEYRTQDYYSIYRFSLSFTDNSIAFYDMNKLYSIFNSGNVQVLLGDYRIYLDEQIVDYIKKNLIIFFAIEESMHGNFEKVYEEAKESWLNSKGFGPEANTRFKRRDNVGNYSVNRKLEEATFIGHRGDKYITTLRSCTCEDFKERDRLKSEFIPCKHMFKLATELGYFKGLSRLPIDRTGSSFLELLDEYSAGYSSGFSTSTCTPWKMPFIVLRPRVRWIELESGKTGNIELYLGFRNIVFDPEPGMDFKDSDYLKCRIEGENMRLGDIYCDFQDTGHYKITQFPTDEIYKRLLDGNEFKVEVFIYGEDEPSFVFCFPQTKGFGSLFQNNYSQLLNGK